MGWGPCRGDKEVGEVAVVAPLDRIEVWMDWETVWARVFHWGWRCWARKWRRRARELEFRWDSLLGGCRRDSSYQPR